jgi:hypothetical protein
MSWRDGSHLDLRGFLTRRPLLGSWVRLLGHLAAALSVCCSLLAPWLLPWLLLGLIILWLAAWRLVVGSLWRGSLVAAIAACAAGLACHQLGLV